MKENKGTKSKTHSGLDYETRKGSKYFDRMGHRVLKNPAPFQVKGSREAKMMMFKIRAVKKRKAKK